jgi:hypothetical protein
MNFLEVIKTLAEVITSVAAAFVVITNLFHFCSNPTIKKFFNYTIPLFLKGYTNLEGKKTRFFKGLKLQHEEDAIITKAILPPDFKMEDVLVLDKKALTEFILNSGVFKTVHQRKE